MNKLTILIISYLVGSIPFGYIIARFVKGVDIRALGSCNVGATNVTRVVGKRWGVLTFLLDFLKGGVVISIVPLFVPSAGEFLLAFCAVLVICGHNWSVFLDFKGGKGVSTSLGVIFGLCLVYPVSFLSFLIAVCVWVSVFYALKIVSVASLSAISVFFISSLFLPVGNIFKLFAFTIFIFVFMRHKDNIIKLLKKEESSF
ncbi:MAG: glycerol-3-phosphate 1-O-acyltransferase PlsY [Candidatus Omnitrophica bacterium]|nr:glycerol-3-phosphate 1-O-acyltransferase PlsY [Candidatus Omnitrophota bacterium]MDD5080808.1 glycerol-3-phosphate 1-O-acyltransferase PlsY [Candidatus Omnitrophota bacterium]MDD5441245.1 glycerol-3-phosphate 1-O-acyltransferase PlsY [Candidatus Omnitrophota bacterium]